MSDRTVVFVVLAILTPYLILAAIALLVPLK